MLAMICSKSIYHSNQMNFLQPWCAQFATRKVGNAIVDLHAKCGNMVFAQKAFEQLERRDTSAWNSILSMYSRHGMLEDVRQIFGAMQVSGVYPNQFTYAIVLSVCARSTDIVLGKVVHCHVIKTGFICDSFCEGSLIDMYAKCRLVDDAWEIFDGSVCSDTVSWTAMIAGYVQVGFPEKALRLFKDMMTLGHIPDQVAFVTVISACMESGHLDDARHLFDQMPNPNVVAWNVMISGHAREVGLVQEEEEEDAFSMFRRMRSDGIAPDEVCFASILSACANIRSLSKGKQLHCLLVKYNMATSLYAGSSLLDMYSKCGVISDAQEIFSSMPEKSVASTNALISGYAQENMDLAVNLFKYMQPRGVSPSEVTLASILDGCNEPSRLNLGRQIHSLVTKYGFSYDDEFLAVSLLGMYFNSQAQASAMVVFSELPNVKSTILWTAVVSGLAQNDCNKEALAIYQEMRKYNAMPDQATFVSVLKACATLASVQDGKETKVLVDAGTEDKSAPEVSKPPAVVSVKIMECYYSSMPVGRSDMRWTTPKSHDLGSIGKGFGWFFIFLHRQPQLTQLLSLFQNSFSGEIPFNISGCSKVWLWCHLSCSVAG
ncbi:hypothetical protein L6452_12158 [Arctium lappa]|uniref:Uncharacterized protein n=1 Tax=Arctium lappa TaxID=4217 RepID=A0ACB9DQP5_ARCLA|nr:hypothetical protein L6452_12158 [Arctium lappa]